MFLGIHVSKRGLGSEKALAHDIGTPSGAVLPLENGDVTVVR